MKITEYPAATTFDNGDVLLKDGGAGTKKIAASDAVFAMLDTVGIPSLHRQLSRWKNLGSSITTAQKASIADGSFRDLWIGDYWTIGGRIYRIVDINYWYAASAGAVNHLVVMPDAPMYQARMNASNTVAGGYANSLMVQSGLASALSTVQTDFGANNVLTRSIGVSSAASASYGENWASSATSIISTKLEIPTAAMISGVRLPVPAVNAWSDIDVSRHGDIQLALFREAGSWGFGSGAEYWLRDILTQYAWACIGSSRRVSGSDAGNTSIGVRPLFAVNG